MKALTDDNRIIQSLWVDGALSLLEQLSVKSFLTNGHDYHLYIYGDVKNIPDGVTVRDAREIMPEDQIFTLQEGWGKGSHGGGFSDLFRYHLLKKHGGWWVDTDIVALKPFDFPSEYVVASSFEGEYGSLANGCVLKLPADSEVAEYLCKAGNKKDKSKLGYAEMGPILVQQAVKEFKLNSSVVSFDTFCPISWRGVSTMAYKESSLKPLNIARRVKRYIRELREPLKAIGKISEKTYAVHLWNEVWRQGKLDKNGTYHPSCLFERLKRKYL